LIGGRGARRPLHLTFPIEAAGALALLHFSPSYDTPTLSLTHTPFHERVTGTGCIEVRQESRSRAVFLLPPSQRGKSCMQRNLVLQRGGERIPVIPSVMLHSRFRPAALFHHHGLLASCFRASKISAARSRASYSGQASVRWRGQHAVPAPVRATLPCRWALEEDAG
jgi:hypothetical protein